MKIEGILHKNGTKFQRGSRVQSEGKLGTVTGMRGPLVRVRFDGKSLSSPCDPADVRLLEADPKPLERLSSKIGGISA